MISSFDRPPKRPHTCLLCPSSRPLSWPSQFHQLQTPGPLPASSLLPTVEWVSGAGSVSHPCPELREGRLHLTCAFPLPGTLTASPHQPATTSSPVPSAFLFLGQFQPVCLMPLLPWLGVGRVKPGDRKPCHGRKSHRQNQPSP